MKQEIKAKIAFLNIDNQLTRVILPNHYMVDAKIALNILNAKQIKKDKIQSSDLLYSSKIPTLIANSLYNAPDLLIHDPYFNNTTRLSSFDLSLLQPKIADFIIPKQYRARIKRFAPSSARVKLANYDRCILGFSLDNENFEGERLKAVISWINKQFKTCLVLFGDSIHQHTLQIKGCRNETEALEQAIAMGQMAFEKNKTLFEESPCQFEYIFAHQVQQFSDYSVYRDHLWALFSKNTAFSKAVNDFSIDFVTRRNNHSNKNLHLATTYLIEELAIFACLEVRGWPIFVYPGTIGICEEIANGKHENVPKPLRNHIHIGLRIGFRGLV